MLHFLIPLPIALVFPPKRVAVAWLVMVSTMLIDVDHLLATPIYDPMRCSINFHPLHTFIPIGVYLVMAILPVTRLVGLGLVIHMTLDSIDCYYNQGIWFTP